MSRHTTDFDPVECIGYGQGDIVIFNHPEHGRDSDKVFVLKHLFVGNRYRVAWVDCGSWHTDVWLEGFPDTMFFNSVHFEKWDESRPTYEQLESTVTRLREAIENLQCLTPSRVEYGNCDCQVCRIKHDKLKEEK